MFKLLSKFQGSKGKRKGNIWRLFRATDFESLMYPCFTVGRILGLFPYKINDLNIKICKSCYVLASIITFFYCVCTLYAAYLYTFSEDIWFTSMPIPRRIKNNCLVICAGFTAVATFILSKPRMRLIQTILELSSRLPSELYQNLSKLIHTKDIFNLVRTCVYASIIIHHLPIDILPIIFLFYSLLMFNHMDTLYINCVFVFISCFKQINNNLMNLTEPVTNAEPHILRETYYNERNLLVELKALKKQHLAISKTVQMLNTIFSLQLLMTIIRIFSENIFVLYFIVMRWKIGMVVENVNDQVYDIFMISTIICFALDTGLVIWVCETGKNQAADIKTTVHSVLNSTSDEQIKHELQLFSLQIVHHKNVFSTKWFNMDVTLLTAMIGGIVTHLVILIQFLFISCNGYSTINSDAT